MNQLTESASEMSTLVLGIWGNVLVLHLEILTKLSLLCKKIILRLCARFFTFFPHAKNILVVESMLITNNVL